MLVKLVKGELTSWYTYIGANIFVTEDDVAPVLNIMLGIYLSFNAHTLYSSKSCARVIQSALFDLIFFGFINDF